MDDPLAEGVDHAQAEEEITQDDCLAAWIGEGIATIPESAWRALEVLSRQAAESAAWSAATEPERAAEHGAVAQLWNTLVTVLQNTVVVGREAKERGATAKAPIGPWPWAWAAVGHAPAGHAPRGHRGQASLRPYPPEGWEGDEPDPEDLRQAFQEGARTNISASPGVGLAGVGRRAPGERRPRAKDLSKRRRGK